MVWCGCTDTNIHCKTDDFELIDRGLDDASAIKDWLLPVHSQLVFCIPSGWKKNITISPSRRFLLVLSWDKRDSCYTNKALSGHGNICIFSLVSTILITRLWPDVEFYQAQWSLYNWNKLLSAILIHKPLKLDLFIHFICEWFSPGFPGSIWFRTSLFSTILH